jgi:hypothetical protein
MCIKTGNDSLKKQLKEKKPKEEDYVLFSMSGDSKEHRLHC